MTRPLIELAGSLILVALVGSAAWAFFPRNQQWNPDFMVGVTAFAIGVVTFFGVTALNRSANQPVVLDDERMRTAVAASLIMSYLYMVCFTTFVANAPIVGEVTKAFIQSFSSVIGITIAFYFGASAAVQIFGKGRGAPAEGTSVESKS